MDELIQTLKQVTPFIWEAAVRQQIIEGFLMFSASFFFAVFGIWTWKQEKKCPNEQQDGKFYVLSCCCFFLCAVLLIFGVMYLINPQYWAIKDLLP